MPNIAPVALCLILALGLSTCEEKANTRPSKNIAWYGVMVHPYINAVEEGVAGFTQDTGIPVKKQIGQTWTQDNENANVEALAAKGYNGFAICPADANAANGLYEELSANGAFVVSYAAPTLLPTTASFCVATDVEEAARLATEALIGYMGSEGRILNVLELIEDPNTILRKRGIEETVARYPEVRIVREIAGMSSIEESTAKIQDALATQVDAIDGIICTGYTPTVAAAAILAEWHQNPANKRIRFVGIDTDALVLNAIAAGHIDATVSQNPYGQGYIACGLLSYLLDGWTANPDHYFVDSGTVLVTRDNLQSYEDEIKTITADLMSQLETRYLSAPE